MIQNITTVKDERIALSKELCAKLADENLTDKERRAITEKLESVTGEVRLPLMQEIYNDLNQLESLLRGNLIGKRVEVYDQEVPNLAKTQRYGWEVAVIEGKKVQYDPTKSDPVYEEIPLMTIEKQRTIYDVQTNRPAIGEIEAFLKTFLERVRTEFKHRPISELLKAKRETEGEIARIDRSAMERCTLNEAEFQDASYIKRPVDRFKNVGPDDALFAKFDAMKSGA